MAGLHATTNQGDSSMVTVARFIDRRDGPQPGQFSIGDREQIPSISDLDDAYEQLMDRPLACILAVMGSDR